MSFSAEQPPFVVGEEAWDSVYKTLHHFLCRHIPKEVPLVLTPHLALEATDSEVMADFSTPVSFALSKIQRKSPQSIAEDLAKILENALHSDLIVKKIVQNIHAVKGYINILLHQEIWENVIKTTLTHSHHYGFTKKGQGTKVNVEYVSANPTGPLHAAHGRGAILGDVIANLFSSQGYNVAREYYINDAGQQVAILSSSVALHCKGQEEGQEVIVPSGFYPGAYVAQIAKDFIVMAKNKGKTWQEFSSEQRGEFAVQWVMKDIQKDLHRLGIFHDIFSSEKELQSKGRLEEMVQRLDEVGAVYFGTLPAPINSKAVPHEEEDENEDDLSKELLLFRSSLWGDTQDRPLKRADGAWTYFAGDIAYHWDKIQRGYHVLIDVWGADHGSHVDRVKGALAAALGTPPGKTLSAAPLPCPQKPQLAIHLYQMVHFFHQGQALKMSKRAGNVLSIPDVLSWVDPDVLRFMMVTKKADTHLDLDVEAMKIQSKDNPVFYVHYAHARGCSVLRLAQERQFFSQDALRDEALSKADFSLLPPSVVRHFGRLLGNWPRCLEEATLCSEPHRIANYLHTLSQSFHGLWTQGKREVGSRFLQSSHPSLSYAYVALVCACIRVLALGLKILGIQAKEEM